MPTAADKIVTWDHAVLMAEMIARFEVDFSLILQAVMHERTFKVTTTYPFKCMIFSLCRSACVPIWHTDHIKNLLGTLDIGLTREEANKLAPRIGPRQKFPSLGDNLADTVAQAPTATHATSETTDTTLLESISSSSSAPSSSRSTLFPALLLFARV